MRHALGILGVLAAGVLLVVSAAMNWRFGVSLGRTEFDGMIYGSASAAADCLKALIPFFLFAAIRGKMWSQAIASAVVGVVVVSYSLTSALGHAALNRLDVSGERQAAASTYKDTRADLARAQEQAGWIPKHRPMLTVQADIDSAKTQSAWRWTNGCTKVKGPKGRAFCQSYHGLQAELAAADQAAALEAKIAGLTEKLGDTKGGSVMAEADPQAAVLTKLAGTLTAWNLKVDDVQTALTVFVALLLEVGSGLGLYVAFSQWRLYERQPLPQKRSVERAREATVLAGDQGAVPEVLSTPSTEELLEVTEDIPERPQIAAQSVVAESDVERVEERDVAPPPEAEDAEVKPKREVRVTAKAAAKPLEAGKPRSDTANDNKSKSVAISQPAVPLNNTQRFYQEAVDTEKGGAVTATDLYEHYKRWCLRLGKAPVARSIFWSEFSELGVRKQKDKAKKKTFYFDIALKTAEAVMEDKKQPVFDRRAA